jgi:hypothetical protein
MKSIRLLGAAVLTVALIVASFHTTQRSTSATAAVPCSIGALAEAFTGQLTLTSMQKYGCEGRWAYAWATVGKGEQAIGVTQVIHFELSRARWVLVSRERDCKANILPSVVYRQGCFSN